MYQWIAVTDRLPPNDDKVLLVCHYDNEENTIYLGRYQDGKWRTIPDDEDRFPLENTTHWMPIPPAP
jgi:hypothetical protein